MVFELLPFDEAAPRSIIVTDDFEEIFRALFRRALSDFLSHWIIIWSDWRRALAVVCLARN